MLSIEMARRKPFTATHCAVILASILLLSCHVVSSAKINAARLLLPFVLDKATNYTLEVEDGGCWSWTSTKPDVAEVFPLPSEDADCSSKALVTVVTKFEHPQQTIVLATEVRTGITLETRVYVDKIETIEIVTQTHELILDGPPVIFTVTAKNNQNDTFSCVEGIQFEWSLPGSKVAVGGGVAISNLR